MWDMDIPPASTSNTWLVFTTYTGWNAPPGSPKYTRVSEKTARIVRRCCASLPIFWCSAQLNIFGMSLFFVSNGLSMFEPQQHLREHVKMSRVHACIWIYLDGKNMCSNINIYIYIIYIYTVYVYNCFYLYMSPSEPGHFGTPSCQLYQPLRSAQTIPPTKIWQPRCCSTSQDYHPSSQHRLWWMACLFFESCFPTPFLAVFSHLLQLLWVD